MNFPSLRSLANDLNVRIIGATLVLLITTTTVLNSYFYVRATHELQTEIIRSHQVLTRILAQNSRLGVFTGSVQTLNETATLLANAPDCQELFFLDEKGDLLLHHAGKAKSAAGPSRVSAQLIFLGIMSHQTNPSFFFKVDEALIFVEPVLADLQLPPADLFEDIHSPTSPAVERPRTIGYVAMQASTENHQRKARFMLIQDITITSIITLVTCLIIFMVVRLFTKPLRHLVQEINQVRSPSEAGGDGEGVIPGDFSQLITLIRGAYQQIVDFNAKLEATVKTRTRQLADSNQELHSQKEGLIVTNQQLATALSKLQVAQSQLVQSEKMAALGMLIAGLSHEIKNSINFIACAVPLLQRNLTIAIEGPLPPGSTMGDLCAKSMPLLAHIQEGVRRTVRVIDDLATFSHDGGTEYVATDVLPGLKASISILRREYGHRIKICEEYAPDLPLILGNSGQLNQVFINILVNAAQAIAETGQIIVKTWATDGLLHISIKDDGHGIEGPNLSKVCDPFFTTKEVGQGTGLGLSVSYSIVKGHDGDLKVSSGPGEGATFEIILPIKSNLT